MICSITIDTGNFALSLDDDFVVITDHADQTTLTCVDPDIVQAFKPIISRIVGVDDAIAAQLYADLIRTMRGRPKTAPVVNPDYCITTGYSPTSSVPVTMPPNYTLAPKNTERHLYKPPVNTIYK